jgi:hypothetical protein
MPQEDLGDITSQKEENRDCLDKAFPTRVLDMKKQ